MTDSRYSRSADSYSSQYDFERSMRSTRRTAVPYEDDWTSGSTRDIRRPDGTAQKRSSASVRKDSYARRRSTVASRSASTAARQYSSDKRASALRGDRILIDDDDLRMDRITGVRTSDSEVSDERLQSMQERARNYKQQKLTPAQVASNHTYKDSNIYSRRNRGNKSVYASHSHTRQWSSPRKENQRKPWVKLAVIAAAVVVVVLFLTSCVFH